MDAFLRGMSEQKASDLYITVGAPVLYRVDGELQPQGDKLAEQEVFALLSSLMDSERLSEFKRSREANFAVVRDCGRFRVSAFFQREQPGAVIRRIETNAATSDAFSATAVNAGSAIVVPKPKQNAKTNNQNTLPFYHQPLEQ